VLLRLPTGTNTVDHLVESTSVKGVDVDYFASTRFDRIFNGTVQQIIFANSIDILESFGEVFEDNANTVGVDETVIGEGVNGRTGRSSASSSASDVWRRLGVLMFVPAASDVWRRLGVLMFIPVRIVSEPTMILGKPMMLAVITTAILEPSMLLDL